MTAPSSQSNVVGAQSAGHTAQSLIQTSVTAPSSSLVSLPAGVSLNLNAASQAGAAPTARPADFAQNLVVHRAVPSANGLDLDHNMYRQSLLRNGIHESYRRETDVSPPLSHENFGKRRASEYEDDDHSVPQRDHNVLRSVMDRPPELSEARVTVEEKRILKPSPLPARLLPVVHPEVKQEPIKTVYVIPQNIMDKKYFLIKNEPPETVHVSHIFINFLLKIQLFTIIELFTSFI